MNFKAVLLASFALVGAACAHDASDAPEEARIDSAAEPQIATSGPTTADTPVGLALRIEEGVGSPLKVRAGQTFYVNQIDLRASLQAGVDEGVAGLAASGDFASLSWAGVKLADESALDTPSTDGTFTNRRFYRDARWMNEASLFTVVQVGANGAPSGLPAIVSTGKADKRAPTDGFFVRRMRAIQWTYDCASRTDCSGAQHFEEEALVELRYAMHPEATFKIGPSTTALKVIWSANPGKVYTIPVEQVAAPQYDYGFQIEMIPVTAPGPDGSYAPGTDLTFELRLKDGSGNLLHTPGQLPSYNAVMSGADTSGIQYYRGLVESFTTYYRRKHMERQLINQISGPAQKVGPIRDVVDLSAPGALGPDGDIYVAAPATHNGMWAQSCSFPTFNIMLGGLYFPVLWDLPNTALCTYHIPADAEAGTYTITQKGRRVYLGQDIPVSKTMEIQIGSPVHTTMPVSAGGCQACHNNNAALTVIGHGNDNLATCTTCHAPLTFELEGPVYVRTHFLHSRSGRFDKPLTRCASCHTTLAGIQRTSKSACLSCHESYPKSHEQSFGPITNMYVGTETGAFDQCSTACHTNHPGSGL
jgi:hypothetical protein